MATTDQHTHTLQLAAAAATVAIATGTYLLTRDPEPPVKPIAPLNKQTIEVPGEPGVRRLNHPICKDKLVERPRDDVGTLYENFQHGLKLSGPSPCLGMYDNDKGGYVWQTYNEVAERFTNFGSGLKQLGQEKGAKIGVYSGNNSEWVLAEQACNAFSFILVPFYDTLGADAIEYIANQANVTVVVCQDKKLELLLPHLAKMPTIRHLVKIGHVTDQEREAAAKHNVGMHSFTEVEALGQQHLAPHVPPSPDTIATIQYTSGTTGKPKGAVLTHKNMVSAMAGALVIITAVAEVTNEDTHFSYLPLAHSFERLFQSIMYMIGARVGFYRGDTRLVLEDLKLLKPSVFISVPRVLNRIHDKIMDQINSGSALKRKLFFYAMEQKRNMMRRGIVTNKTLWDRLVFAKIQSALGGKLRGIVSGAAPLSPPVLDFFRCTMGCFVVSGYGLTENGAAACVTLPGDVAVDHVGPPMPANEIRLVDVPDMGFRAADGRGEVTIRGPNVFQGYFEDEENPADMLRGGWLYTGDIGEWTEDGALRIIDRRKHMFKLAQGEYIVPEKIETIYSTVKGLLQVYIHGDSTQTACIALCVPDPDTFPAVCRAQNLGPDGATLDVLCACDDVKKYFLQQLNAAGKAAGLYGFEQARAIHFTPHAFSVENDLLTPTFKTKRPAVRALYKPVFDEIYASMEKGN
eukprot:comp22236_c0_seq1/m.32797 comp22236_c0_seq1/g.32797  ORF comp22236_c0_seq1/g.32797 comp22236_c0_seq1/m.32797 type:complete len:688 (-) comp22236_c0_seq1:594-2657(-)